MISIVVPVYYEQDNILDLFKRIDYNVTTPHEVLVVYDDPSDPTFEVVDNYIKSYKRYDTLLVKSFVGSGRGPANAIISGMKAASGEAVVVVMADLSDNVFEINRMVEAYEAGADIVCASRYMPGGMKIGGPPMKRILAELAGRSLYYFRGIPTRDITHNFNLYRREVLDSIQIESKDGFEVAMEIKVKAFLDRRKIVEIPTIWAERTQGESKFDMKWVASYLKWYFYALSHSRKPL